MNESYGVTMQKGNSEKPVQCCSVFTLFSLELIKAGDPDQTWRPHSSHLENASLGLSTCHFFCFTSFSGIGFQVPLVLNRQLGTWYYFCRRIGRGDPAPAWTIRLSGSCGKWSVQFSLTVQSSKFWFLGAMVVSGRTMTSFEIFIIASGNVFSRKL